jgi:transcriptional regulator NrdR family protein
MKEIFVIKRNGDKQVFDAEKIQRVALASGISPLDSEEIVESIISWLENRASSNVSSLEIRDKLFKELERVDKNASGLFAWHQNRKNI